MRFRRRQIHPAIAASLLLLALSSAAVRAEEPPDGEVETQLERPDRFRLGTRLGLILPGGVTPKDYTRSTTSAGPLLSAEFEWRLHPYFSIGSYVQAAYFQVLRNGTYGNGARGDGFLMSGGFSAKARFQLSETWSMNVGALLGLNATYTGAANSYSAVGLGYNIAPSVQLAHRFTPRFGGCLELGFVAQPGGSAVVNGSQGRSLSFPPLFFSAVGGELFL